MTTKSNGGPAYPVSVWNNDTQSFVITGGMSLRDHFAGLAMQEMLRQEGFGLTDIEAAQCYDAADAMIRARDAQ